MKKTEYITNENKVLVISSELKNNNLTIFDNLKIDDNTSLEKFK